MKKKMNNKGYMLIEIILAFAITFALIYFIMDIVIEMKNKNDDLLVKTVVTTDKAIISNELMQYAAAETDTFDCSQLVVNGQKITYRGNVIDIVSDYAVMDGFDNTNIRYCNTGRNKVTIRIPLVVKQMSDESFDVFVDYRYGDADVWNPECSLSQSVSDGQLKIIASAEDPEDLANGIVSTGIAYQGWNEDYTTDNGVTVKNNVSSVGTYTYYVMDNAGNEGSCEITINDIP